MRRRRKPGHRSCAFPAARTKFPFVAGGFFSHADRDYGQTLPVTGFEELSGIPTQGLRAPKDTLFFSDLGYKLNQFALFGEGTLSVTDEFSVTGGLRFYHFSEDKEQVFDGIFANDNNGTSLVSQPGFDGRQRRGAAGHCHLQAVGPRQLERAGLARVSARRDQRSAQRPTVHAAGPRHVRRTRHLEGREGLELRGRASSRAC